MTNHLTAETTLARPSETATTTSATAATTDVVACAHCGLPSPAPDHDDQLAFCCAGCRGAYELIHGWGLEDYYALRDRLAPGVSQAVIEDPRCAELDDPELLGVSAPQPTGGGLLVSRLAVDGLHCGACAWLIERAAELEPGWHSARVRMNDHSADIVFDPNRVKLSRIAQRLGQLGYRLSPLGSSGAAERAAAENRRLLVQIAVAGFCAANAMWIAVALYAGEFSGIAADHAAVLRWAGVLLGIVAVAGPGRTFFRGAWASLRTLTPHMDLPVALGLGVGATAGLVGAIAGQGDVYFDSIAVLVFFLLVGRWVQFRQQRRAAESVGLLMRLTPRAATRIEDDGSTRKVPADRLRVDDRVRVLAGEGMPADGVVVAGESTLDRSLLTGESRPVAVAPGDPVFAATGNLGSPLDVRITAVGSDSRVGQLMRIIEDASQAKAPLVQLADSVGGWFVSIVIGLSLITLVAWWRVSPAMAAQHAVALLIVACPCALALATPLALAVNLGRAAKRRLLVRGGDVLERLARPGHVWFDKTGTLTEGRFRVTDVFGPDPERALAWAAAVETLSRHPIAIGILAAANQRRLTVPDATQIDQIPGDGITGMVAGHRVVVGNRQLMRRREISIDPDVADRLEAILRCGATVVMIAIDGHARNLIRIEDRIRSDARPVIDRLRRDGWSVGILSGDHPETVGRVAEMLGIESTAAIGGLSPEEKLARIAQSHQTTTGTVVMVGDGVNDAASLAAADVGVAVRGGAEACLQAAPVYLADGQLTGLTDLTAAARRTVRIIRRNFAVSLTYNVVAVMLAMGGVINPLMAAVLMPISSLSVLSLTLISPAFAHSDRAQADRAQADRAQADRAQ
jgi:Cu2+-exporting ATPase